MGSRRKPKWVSHLGEQAGCPQVPGDTALSSGASLPTPGLSRLPSQPSVRTLVGPMSAFLLLLED